MTLPPSVRNSIRVVTRKARTVLQGPVQHPDYVRATHYFGSGWALNFLQVVDRRSLRVDMEQIVADGFNTVILVVPWRGLQTDHLVPSYDDFYLRQLELCLSAAQSAGLAVIVRLSYAHQILDRQPLSGLTSMQRLLTDADTQYAWLDYIEQVHELCFTYRCFMKAFISWEEFWHSFWRWQLYTPQHREQLAEETGYSQYLVEQGLDCERRIPREEEPDYAVFHAFMNHRIRDMHRMARERVPALGIEVRVDMDRLQGADGAISWLESDSFTDLEVTRYTYWAPFMGAENKGETLGSDRAIELLSRSLERMTEGGLRADHIIDQFNFVDDAPKFRGIHAQIAPDEVSTFLSAAVPLLREQSSGYGIWAYRDYRQNVLYNPRFRRGMEGWRRAAGKVRVLRNGGIRLSGGAILCQVLPARIAGLQTAVPFDKFECIAAPASDVGEGASLEVRLNAGTWCPLRADDKGELVADIPVARPVILEDGIVIELRQSGRAITLDHLFLFHFVFRGGYRDEHNAAADHYSQVLAFNRALDAYAPILENATDQTD